MLGGIDLGGTKVAVGVAGPDGEVVASDRFPTRPERGPEAVFDEAAERLRALAARAGGGLDAVGLASVGPLDLETGTILSPPNFPTWKHVAAKELLESRLGAPVRVDNDANAAAWAEYKLGAGRGARVLVYATVSTGVGGGLVVDGRLLHGLGGGAGELGHQTVDPEGPPCPCGNRGCLEAIASGTAIARAGRQSKSPAILALAGGPEAVHAGHVAAAAAAGDPAAARIWARAVEALAVGLGNVVTIVAPDRLVIGGGVAAAGELLLAPLREGLARRVKLVPVERLELRLAERVHDAGLAGAIALAL